MSQRPKSLRASHEARVIALVGRQDGSLRIRLPVLSDGTVAVLSAEAGGAAPERCSRQIRILVDRNEGIRLPPRRFPQDQYAKGILSLSEKQTELVWGLWRNSNESRLRQGPDGFRRQALRPCHIAIPPVLGLSRPDEDGSLNV